MPLTRRIALAWRLARAAVSGKINVEPENIAAYLLTHTAKVLLEENNTLIKENVDLRARVEQLTIAQANLSGSPYRNVKPS